MLTEWMRLQFKGGSITFLSMGTTFFKYMKSLKNMYVLYTVYNLTSMRCFHSMVTVPHWVLEYINKTD